MENLSHEEYVKHLREQDFDLFSRTMRSMRILSKDTLIELKYQYDGLLSELAKRSVDTVNLKEKFDFELAHHACVLQDVDSKFDETRRQMISTSYANLQIRPDQRREYSIKCYNFQARFLTCRLEEKRKFCKDLIDRVRAINIIILANC